MKILITGGAGFIGSHLVDSYINLGCDVVIVDNLYTGKLTSIHPKAKFYLLDYLSDEMKKVFENEKPDIVNHHAAQKSVPNSVNNPVLDAEINIVGIIRLLDLCIKYNVKRFIFSSTGGALYGDTTVIPTSEKEPISLNSPYAISKYTSEKYIQYYSTMYGLNYMILRYANVYGPRQSSEGECGVLPIFIKNLLNELPSYIYSDSSMPYGTTRDYVYVKDVCIANVLSLNKGQNEILNIGCGQEVYTEQLYQMLLKLSGKHLPLINKGSRVGDVRRSSLDCSRAEKILGWKAQTNINNGVSLTFQYYKEVESV